MEWDVLIFTISATCSCSKAMRATFITGYIGITVVQGMFRFLDLDVIVLER